MKPASLCAACLAPLRDRLARATDIGWTCADDPLCAAIAHRLTTTRKEATVSNYQPPTTPAEQAAILATYEAGASISDTARKHYRSREAVRRILRQSGTAIRSTYEQRELTAAARHRGALTPPREDEIAYRGGWVNVRGIMRPTKPMRGVAA